MKTKINSEKSTHSHNNPSNLSPSPNPVPAPAAPPTPPDTPITPPLNPFTALIPPALRDRRFRALSFASTLDDEQRAVLSKWLCNRDYSIEQIRQKVGAPSPEGFGLSVQPTTLRRLRKLLENSDVSARVTDAFDTAYDLLEDESHAHTAPLHQALSLMVYARAVRVAQKQTESADLHRLVTIITKLEKLKPAAISHRPLSMPKPFTSRHRIELTVTPAYPQTLNTATP